MDISSAMRTSNMINISITTDTASEVHLDELICSHSLFYTHDQELS
jgi:hypothetical protein